MKLSLNATGAWRNIVEFDERFLVPVKCDSRQLALTSRGRPPKLRITDDHGAVLCYCEGADYQWRAAR